MHKILLKATDNGTRMGTGQWKSDKNGYVKLTKKTLDFRKIKIKEFVDDCGWELGQMVHNKGSKVVYR